MEPRTEIVKIVLEDGTTVNMEVSALGGEEDVSFDALPFEGVAGAIEKIAATVLTPIKKVKPKKATVEFGLSVGLESGKLTALWVKGQGAANIKVSLEWEG